MDVFIPEEYVLRRREETQKLKAVNMRAHQQLAATEKGTRKDLRSPVGWYSITATERLALDASSSSGAQWLAFSLDDPFGCSVQ